MCISGVSASFSDPSSLSFKIRANYWPSSAFLIWAVSMKIIVLDNWYLTYLVKSKRFYWIVSISIYYMEYKLLCYVGNIFHIFKLIRVTFMKALCSFLLKETVWWSWWEGAVRAVRYCPLLEWCCSEKQPLTSSAVNTKIFH